MRIGSDPELFLVDSSNKFISSIGLIGGSKENPFLIRADGCAVQEDNVAVEFNIPACESVGQFIESINFNLEYLTNKVKEKGLSLKIVPSAEFEEDQLNNPMALEFGCDPDFNAWTKRRNPRPKTANKALRSAGGHVHVGCREENINPWDMIKAMDLFLGVPSLEFDSDRKRRDLYGKAGACRIKTYGAEYRTLSNFWIKDDDMKRWVYTQTHAAADWIKKGGVLTEEDGKKIQHCINTSDMNLMKEIRAEYGV